MHSKYYDAILVEINAQHLSFIVYKVTISDKKTIWESCKKINLLATYQQALCKEQSHSFNIEWLCLMNSL